MQHGNAVNDETRCRANNFHLDPLKQRASATANKVHIMKLTRLEEAGKRTRASRVQRAASNIATNQCNMQ